MRTRVPGPSLPRWRRHRRLRGLVAFLIGAACAWLGPQPAAARPALTERLNAALSVRGLAGARVSALVVDRDTGDELFSRSPDRPLVPASNQKLLTGIGVLSTLGPAHRFATEILSPAPPGENGAVAGLFVRGGGDPALTSEDWWRLAADLRLLGLRRVAGPLVMDDRLFDDERWQPSWGDPSARAYHAPVGALMANYGAFRVTVTPGRAGQLATVAIDPPVDYLELRAHVLTTQGGQKKLSVSRTPLGERERIEVRGRIPSGAESSDHWRSVTRPARYAGAVFEMQLRANGVVVDGPVQVGRVPAGARVLHVHDGRPLAEIARLFLKYSNNVIAESLLKSLALASGAERGTWVEGRGALRRSLEGLGLEVAGLELADGSGLSRENRVSPRLLVAALRRAEKAFGFGPELVAALPLAAADGTLEKRAAGAAGRVRAKTGLLSGVTGLSGFARSPGGRDVVFSVLANGYENGDGAAMDAIDAFATALGRD